MKRALISVLTLALAATLAWPVPAQDLGSQVVGVWKYISVNNKEVATGKIIYPFGETPRGYIVYTKGGRLLFSFVGDNRTKPAGASATDVERVNLFNTLAAGSGTYKVEGNTITVTYDTSWHQLWTGTTHKRNIALAGNRLTLTSAPTKDMAGQEIVFETIVERIE